MQNIIKSCLEVYLLYNVIKEKFCDVLAQKIIELNKFLWVDLFVLVCICMIYHD